MNFWKSLSGFLEVELSSAALPEAMAKINAVGIGIRYPQWKNDLTVTFQIRRVHYRQLKLLTEKRGESLHIRRHLGLYWQGKRLAGRPVLVAGFLLLFLLSTCLPGRILWVRVDGNQSVPDNRILEAAEAQGVTFGASRREIRSERIKNGILSEIPQLQWVGVNTSGCVANISVRERTVAADETQKPPCTRIVADRDGYILSGTAARGTMMFQPGQTVSQGQVLISGYVDGGFCIRSVRPEGEIMAQTNRKISAVTPASCLYSGETKDVKQKISLLVRKKRINLWKDSGISDTTCGRMYKEYYITLPGGFRLPFALCVDVYRIRDAVEAEQDPQAVRRQLQTFSEGYLRKQMIMGTIRSNRETFASDQGRFLLRSQYVCEEMIGREQGEANE